MFAMETVRVYCDVGAGIRDSWTSVREKEDELQLNALTVSGPHWLYFTGRKNEQHTVEINTKAILVTSK